ncbi:MAG: hypothetical protein ACI4RH_06770 [Huintestinicola sp.]
MKYTMKLTASLMAAAMSFSVLGAASAGAVDFYFDDNVPITTDPVQTLPNVFMSDSVQDAVPEYFDGCIKFTWNAVPSAANYAIKICNTDYSVVKTYYVTNKFTALVVPESVFGVFQNNTEKDFYVCVVALKRGESDNASKVFYAPSSSKITVSWDMSKYPDYGSAQDVAFMVKDGKLLIGWKNSNDFATPKDIFTVNITDQSNKTIFSKEVAACNVEAKGLKDGQTYKVKIYNKSFAAMTEVEYKFESDVVSNGTGQSNSEKPPKKGTEYTLPAPISINAKKGDGKVTLSWSSVDEAYAYRVYMYDAKSKTYKKYKTVKNPKCTVKGLTNGKTYKFKVTPLRYNSETKKYTPGKSSRVVSCTPKKPQNNKK